ncbi:MAG: hypothetical protein ACOC3W_09745, partial [Thermodesulfobacteriota bacterium]
RISADDPRMTYNGENRLTEAEYQILIGDITGEGSVDLADAVSALQVAAGMTPSGVTADGDIDDDGRIGIEEAIYALLVVAEMRMPAESSRKLVMAYDALSPYPFEFFVSFTVVPFSDHSNFDGIGFQAVNDAIFPDIHPSVFGTSD